MWSLWSVGCATTVARVALRFRVQGTFRAEDYFAILAFVFLTALAAVVTRESPIFEMTQTYELAAAVDPSTPLPLPADEYISRTTTALKLMFAYGTRRPRILPFSDSSQANALILVHPLGRLVILEPLQRNYYHRRVFNNLMIEVNSHSWSSSDRWSLVYRSICIYGGQSSPWYFSHTWHRCCQTS